MATILQRRRPLSQFRDGIHLDFRRDFHYVKAQGGAVTRAPFTSLFTFTRAAPDATFRGQNGLIQTATTNIPRIEYDANGNVLGLLAEGSRQNLLLQSQDFGTTWANTNSSETLNSIASPDGTVTADSLVEDATAAAPHGWNQSVAKAAVATQYTYSVWVKANARTFAALYADGTGGSVEAHFNLSTGVISTAIAASGTWVAGSASISAYANGWYRCAITFTDGAGVAVTPYLLSSNGTTWTLNGNSSASLYAWGAQLEAAAFPSSYIPTTTVAVTRAADNAQRTFGSDYDTTKGTTFAEFDLLDVNGTYGVFARDANSRHIYVISAPAVRMFDGTTAVSALAAPSANTMYRAASSFDAGGMSFTGNGGAVQTGAYDGTWGSGAVVCLGQDNAGGTDPLFGHIRRLDYYPTRFSNETLQRLTA